MENVVKKQEDLTKVVLASTFIGVFGLFAFLLSTKKVKTVKLTAYDVMALVFSTLRIGRMMAFDKVFEPFRSPVAVTKPDESGAGDTTAPKGSGIRRSLGELMTCPICAGTWVAAGLVYGIHLAPTATRLFITFMGTIGMAEVLNDLTEHLSWTGQAARQEAGDK